MPPRAREIRRDDIPNLLCHMKRFWDCTDMQNDCWLWKGYVPTKTGPSLLGYGKFRVNNHEYLAHRFLWAMLHGSIPSNLYVLHHCDNPLCVRPSHLFTGTLTDNMLDMYRKGRHPNNGIRGEGNGSSHITEHEVQQVFELHAAGLRQWEIGKIVGLSQSQTGDILLRRAWTHVPAPPGYVYESPRRLSEAKAQMIYQLAEEGYTYAEIAKKMGISWRKAYYTVNLRKRPHLPAR